MKAELSKGTYLIGSNLVLTNNTYTIYFIEGSGLIKIYNNENRQYILTCEFYDEDVQEKNKITLTKGMLISVEGTLKIQLIHEH